MKHIVRVRVKCGVRKGIERCGGEKWNEVELKWREVEWSGMKWREVEWSGIEVEWSGMKWREVEWRGIEVERSGMKWNWSGMKWREVEWSGIGVERGGIEVEWPDWGTLRWIRVLNLGNDLIDTAINQFKLNFVLLFATFIRSILFGLSYFYTKQPDLVLHQC